MKISPKTMQLSQKSYLLSSTMRMINSTVLSISFLAVTVKSQMPLLMELIFNLIRQSVLLIMTTIMLS